MLTVITPTRNRPVPFSLAEMWMARQSFRDPVQWIVVNDGSIKYRYTAGQLILLRKANETGIHSLNANLIFALPYVLYKKIAILEDDDWIGPDYLALLCERLDSADLVGTAPAIYYNLARRRCRILKNPNHASLGQTGFTEKVIDVVKRIALCGNPSIDLRLWTQYEGSKYIFRSELQHVSFKSLPGERGIGIGHRMIGGRHDADFRLLESLVGTTDAKTFKELYYKYKLYASG